MRTWRERLLLTGGGLTDERATPPAPLTFGSSLRQVRERPRLSLPDLEAITHISRPMLHRLERNQIGQTNPAVAAPAGLPDLHFHCLRHIAATLLLRRGVRPKVVSEMLGHADISITFRVYAHVTPTMQQAAVDVTEHIFGSHAR